MRTKEKTIGENLDFIRRNKVYITIESRHLPGVADHNLMCWICNRKSAIYLMNPHWIFMPCRKCQGDYIGFWTKKIPWWQFWKSR